MIMFVLKLNCRYLISYKELKETGFLRVSEIMKQLKLGQVFKIRNKICPSYMNTNFKLLSENVNISSTRSFQFNIFIPITGSQGTKTFFTQASMIGIHYLTVLKKLKMRIYLKKS